MALLGVTGARGFIGREFIELARRRGHELRLLSRSGGTGGFDLRDEAVDPALLEGCDSIIHLAAQLPFDAPDEVQARECWEVNALGTLKLMRAMGAAGVPRLILTTSANAYAPWCPSPNEEAPLYPRSRPYYLGSKIMQEYYARAFGAEEGMRVSCLRLASAYGPGEGSLVGRLAAALLRNEMVRVENGGVFGADFVHVADVAEAILLIEGQEEDGIWNVASGRRSTIFEIAEMLAALAEVDRSRVEIEPVGAGSFDGYPAIDIAKIRSLGFSPARIEEGLRRTMDALRSAAPSRAQHSG
jgi:UDP-glucose 4-epimerase